LLRNFEWNLLRRGRENCQKSRCPFVYSPGDGADTITDFNTGNTGNTGTLNDGDSTNNDFIDLSSFYDDIWELHADQADDGILNQSNDGVGGADYTENDRFAPDEGLTFLVAFAANSSFSTENIGVVCFTAGTAIRTPRDDVQIDDLRVGDLVTTMNNGPHRIRWIGTTSVGAAGLAANPDLRPVLIRRGILGAERDLLVSPQHGMIRGPDHLARATHLAGTIKGIWIANSRKRVTYVHLMFEAHQIMFAENTPTESFYPGPVALRMMDAKTRSALFGAFPNLAMGLDKEHLSWIYGPTAWKFVHKRDIQRILDAPGGIGVKNSATPREKNGGHSVQWPEHARH